MKTKIFTGILMCFAVLLSTSASAVPVTMALETLGADQDTPFVENGFVIQAPGEHLHATFNLGFGLPGVGTNAAQMAADTTGTRLNQVGGGLFDLLSLEASNVIGHDAIGQGSFAVQIDGLLGGVVQASMQLSSGTVAVIDFVSAGGWLSLDEVQFWYSSQGAFGNFSSFTGDDFKFDNIVVEAATVSNVPVPAAVWLFFSALGGLGVMRRKQAVA